MEVNEDALGRLEKRLREIGTHRVAVVSVMGAFRTGKSFLLDLFLRFLRYEAAQDESGSTQTEVPQDRGSNEPYSLPAWVTAAGNSIEGGSDEHSDGFRFKGGMDACTEGIWVWSEPFIRTIRGQKVALLLMDTQGAWDSNMTKEQSATIFGLTAVLSSKQIYNINMQIQEDKVENLAYFMRFAQAALRQAAVSNEQDSQKHHQADIEKPFQSLDFLVRDWRHFKEDWSMEQCKEQMEQHLSRHVNPQKVVENSTAEALHSMFQRMSCFCLPHPGLVIERDTWTGNIADVSPDFIRLVDNYIRNVFTEGLDTKSILGSDLSTVTFPMVLRDFVLAFHDASPVAMSFTQAMTNCTVLLAKEQAMKSYTKKMDLMAEKAPRGLDPVAFEEVNRTVTKEIQAEYERITIFGSDDTRTETWDSITENLHTLYVRYTEDNMRRLEKALVAFANIALLGLCLFVLDRISDWTCDWWSQTCVDLSKVMLIAYVGIFGYIGFQAYVLFNDRGRIAAALAGGELWKEMMRLVGAYGDLIQKLQLHEIPDIVRKVVMSQLGGKVEAPAKGNSDNKKRA